MILELQNDLKTKCCPCLLSKGTKLEINNKISKNRVYVTDSECSGRPVHIVQIGSLKMAIKQSEITNLVEYINEKNNQM